MGTHTQGTPSASLDWMTIASDSGAAAMVIDQYAKVQFMNEAAARVYARRGGATGVPSAGTALLDLLPPLAASERSDVARLVIQTGEPLVFRELWNGWAMHLTVRRMAGAGDNAAPTTLWIGAPESLLTEDMESRAGLRVIDAKHVDLGPLSALTISELKVLALIGEGMSNAEIAAKLHRAVKTVESHRAALTDKTGSTSRVQLGMMARRAGLVKRVQLNEPLEHRIRP